MQFQKKFSAFKFSPKLWDKPARTALGPFLRLWSTQTVSALGSSMTRVRLFGAGKSETITLPMTMASPA